jgi:hypothetical protein
MDGYFDESGSPSLARNGVFIIVGVWSKDERPIQRFMRKWLRDLHSEGYPHPEIKGSELTDRQRTTGVRNIRKRLGPIIQSDFRILIMDSLIQDHRLYHPRKWTETEIHQAILYEMIIERIEKHYTPMAKIAIDGRHTLPGSFFHRVESIVRKHFSSNMISISRGSSNLQKGIQLSDVLCYTSYRAVRSAIRAGVRVQEELIHEEVQTPATIKIISSEELLRCLTGFQSIGGPS